MKNRKKAFMLLCYLLLVPLLVGFGALLWRGAHFALISMLVAVVSCLPFCVFFEKGKVGAGEVAVIAVMSALSVLGRVVFALVPAFKPVSAVVMITGIAFGPMAGFMTGSMSAIVSNLFFGQGPWTPFQMLVWGLLGFASGLIFRRGRAPSRVLLILAGIVGGFVFSLGMDVYTVLSTEGAFSWDRYLFYAIAALPTTLTYAASNVVFLLALTRPLLKKTERMRVKFGVFDG